MKLQIEAVALQVTTASRMFSRTCRFGRGLNVVRGSNSSGKTQVFQAITYALGMEDMLGSKLPLGSAFTTETMDASGASETVTSSWVALEMRNAAGRQLSVQRYALHPTRAPNLVRVWEGPAISDAPSAIRISDHYVNEGGAATADLGFHRLLAEFLDWRLPEVPRYSSDPGPLYIQVLFPFLYVDQRAGWSSAGPRAVTRYQIREPTRRAAEFLLGMAGPQALAERDRLRRQLEALGQRWTLELTAARAALGAAGGRLEGLPDSPAGLRGNANAPTKASASMLILTGEEWTSLQDEIDNLAAQIAAPAQVDLSVDADASTAAELLQVEERLGATIAAASVVEQQLALAESQRSALARRLMGLEEESARLRDVRKLVRLGSHDPDSHLADTQCPTCHQALLGVETEDPSTALGIEESAAIVNAQLATIQGMRDQVERAAASYHDSFQALQRESDLLRVRVRALRSDLVRPDGFPSRGEVAGQVAAEVRYAELSRAAAAVTSRLETLQDIAVQVLATRKQLSGVPSDTSVEDQQVIADVTEALQSGLAEIGFGSYDADKITLDPDTLRPRRAGLEIDDDVSSSDVVRVKIAYLDGIRRVAGARGAPHPGLLLMDEPRQHEMDEDHFRAALGRLAESKTAGDQVIVSSAATPAALETYLPGPELVTLIDLGEGRILQPASASQHPLFDHD